MSEKEIGNNVIYFDQNCSGFPDKNSDIYNDAELFKLSTNGTFILVTNFKKLIMVFEQIEEKNTTCQFDLITTGSSSIEVMDLINKGYTNIIKRVCLYTYHPEKYQEMKKKYPLIKGIFYTKNEIIKFLNEGEDSTIKFTTSQIITLQDYVCKYSYLHRILANHYGNNSTQEYGKAIEKVKNFLKNPEGCKLINNYENQEQILLNALEVYKDIDKNYQKIISDFTDENIPIYRVFCGLLNRLNKNGIEAFGWFIAGFMYSLDKIAKIDNLGLRNNEILYKVVKLNIIDILNFERMINSIITFPTFISTTRNEEIVQSLGYKCANKIFNILFIFNYKSDDSVLYNAVQITEYSMFGEDECVILPFSFFKVVKVDIDYENYKAEVMLDCYSRNKIIEQKIQSGKSFNFYDDLVLLK